MRLFINISYPKKNFGYGRFLHSVLPVYRPVSCDIGSSGGPDLLSKFPLHLNTSFFTSFKLSVILALLIGSIVAEKHALILCHSYRFTSTRLVLSVIGFMLMILSSLPCSHLHPQLLVTWIRYFLRPCVSYSLLFLNDIVPECKYSNY